MGVVKYSGPSGSEIVSLSPHLRSPEARPSTSHFTSLSVGVLFSKMRIRALPIDE